MIDILIVINKVKVVTCKRGIINKIKDGTHTGTGGVSILVKNGIINGILTPSM